MFHGSLGCKGVTVLGCYYLMTPPTYPQCFGILALRPDGARTQNLAIWGYSTPWVGSFCRVIDIHILHILKKLTAPPLFLFLYIVALFRYYFSKIRQGSPYFLQTPKFCSITPETPAQVYYRHRDEHSYDMMCSYYLRVASHPRARRCRHPRARRPRALPHPALLTLRSSITPRWTVFSLLPKRTLLYSS